MIVPGNWRAHHDLYQRFGQAIYDPWWRPPQHLKTTDPYHFWHGLMAPAILASLEQEHPPAARIPLAHEYDRAHGPQAYNPYQVIPREEHDRLLSLSLVNGQMDIEKYGHLLEEAALNIHLQRTVGKNVQLAADHRSWIFQRSKPSFGKSIGMRCILRPSGRICHPHQLKQDQLQNPGQGQHRHCQDLQQRPWVGNPFPLFDPGKRIKRRTKMNLLNRFQLRRL